MRSFPVLYPVTTAATSFTSVPLSVGDDANYWIGVLISGSDVAGSLKLQASLDPSVGVWFDVPSSTQAITSSADGFWNASGVSYPWVRVSWTYTSGTGNISAVANIAQPYLRWS